MAGIYLHIPFCKTRCAYCDFYSTTRSPLRRRYVQALCTELRERRDYLGGEEVKTIYLGGGTPSQLDGGELEMLFAMLDEVYGTRQCEEITLEANPDDLTEEYVEMLRRLPVNRISMGVQTFDDATLRLLNRRHTARQAVEAVERCRRAGFDNLSIDLIYGLPGETDERWRSDLSQAVALGVEHLSAYHLTYEEGTPLYRMLQEHRVSEVDEDSSVRFFTMLMDTLSAAGYEHYEISNFCKPGRYARHNTAYWQGIPYLGCGPSAHSFNRIEREWNVASLDQYLAGIESGNRRFEVERLDTETHYNEYIMTGLRTRWGVSPDYVQETFGVSLYRYLMEMAAPYLKGGKLELEDGSLRLTRAGIFVSDGIISDLMSVES